MRDTERESETYAEGEIGSLWGILCRTRTQDPGIMTSAKGRCSTTEPPRCPKLCPVFYKKKKKLPFSADSVSY